MQAAEFHRRSSKVPKDHRAGQATSVWFRDEPPVSRSSPLSRERVVNTAVTLLDQYGINGLTMRRLAQSLDVTATALYWHVNTKEDVIDLALDRIISDVPLHDPTPNWRNDVRRLMHSWRTVMLRHPWAPNLVGRAMLGPHVLARTEYLQSALQRGGFADTDLAVVTRLLANYVIGAALTEATFRQTVDSLGQADARRAITANPAAYPVLNASGHLDANRWNDDELFDRGLDAILATAPSTKMQ